MLLVDHTEPNWLSRIRRVSGALTYSQDLVKYQVENWRRVLPGNSILSTCPRFSNCDISGDFDTAVQYLHTYPYYNAVEDVEALVHTLPFKAKKFLAVSAYYEFVQKLNNAGIKTIYVPMGIDVDSVVHYRQAKSREGIVWFGNVVQDKVYTFNQIRSACRDFGIKFDFISHGRLNNEEYISHTDALKRVSEYQYGIGVGRCAQEMLALGVKVLIAGKRFGGLMMNEADYQVQLATNMNGRRVTFSTSIEECLANIDNSFIKANDIRQMDHTKDYDRKIL